EHVVLERDTVMHTWADARWDSFSLVTPNFQCRLPGYAYDGAEPDGFMVRKEILDWLAGFVAGFGPPVVERTAVTSVRPLETGTGFEVRTSGATYLADQVVVATGGYDKPVTDKPVEERTQDRTNHYVTGRDGGRDIDLRAFAAQGMTLHGRLMDVADGHLRFDADLERNLDAADEVYNGINTLIDEFID